jgi:hypothetical protein
MARKYYERRSLRNALNTYLTSKSWTDITYREGFANEETITVPLVAVHFLPTNSVPLQIGSGSEKLFKRVVQIDAYMESEPRADAICDDIMDFLDIVPVSIVDATSAMLGSLICQDTGSIYSETFAPILPNPKVIRWRGIVRATLEAHYY